MAAITQTNNSSLPTSVSQASSWRQAVNELIDHKISRGECFSSGEVAAILRTHRPDLRFSVTTLGEHVRDLFYTGGMALYTDNGGMLVSPCQVPRTTQGLGRTPAGQTVFVYGPNHAECMSHHFEVDIPRPGQKAQTKVVNVTPQSLPTPPPPALPSDSNSKTPVVISGSKAPSQDDLTATVHTDRRLCIPRRAFEYFVEKSGHLLRGGDSVSVSYDGNQITVTMKPTPSSIEYNLALTRGRILLVSPDSSKPFVPGDKYDIQVTSDALVIDL